MRRLIEDAETRDEVASASWRSGISIRLTTGRGRRSGWRRRPLCLSQPEPEPLGSLLGAFRIGSAEYKRLLRQADRAEIVAKFRDLERLKRKNEVQYELQIGASRRLLELVCDSEVVRLRSRPGPFDWVEALRQWRLIAFDGGGIRSRELKRTLFLLAGLQVIHAVRRHFAETQQPLPVVLVLEEAGALGLVTPLVLRAFQELRKAGLAIHLITQSSVDFGDRGVFEAILANTPWQAWYQVLSPADQELGAKALAPATFESLAIHYTRNRVLHDGAERVETVSRTESFDPRTPTTLRHDRRTGTVFRPRYREIVEA